MALYVRKAGDTSLPLGMENHDVPPQCPCGCYPDPINRTRNHQENMISAVIGSLGTIRYGESLKGTPYERNAANGLRIQREKYAAAVRALAEYTHTPGPGLTVEGRMELIKAAGEDQDKVILAALTR